MVKEFPNLSIRKAASAVNVSTTLMYSILHDDLHLKPYKFNVWQKLEIDYQKRVDFAQWFLSLALDAKFRFICSEEAYFYLTLTVNKQNQRIWSELQPNEGVEIPLHDEKILVWCAISATKIYGVYFFEESVNQHNYLDMIQSFLAEASTDCRLQNTLFPARWCHSKNFQHVSSIKQSAPLPPIQGPQT